MPLLDIHTLISNEDFVKCANFAKRVVSTNSYYANRGQTDIARIIYQIIIGKLGELGSKQYIESLGRKCTNVDFSITKNHKSFDADLVVNRLTNIHVKSQDTKTAEMFTPSWTFQFGGNGSGNRDTKVFDTYSMTDAIIFTIVDVEKKTVDIKATYKLAYLHQNKLFDDPKKNDLKGIKKVVYYSKLVNLSKQRRV